jgi:hypothetical protein
LAIGEKHEKIVSFYPCIDCRLGILALVILFCFDWEVSGTCRLSNTEALSAIHFHTVVQYSCIHGLTGIQKA